MTNPFEEQGNPDYSRLDAVSYAFFNKGLHALSKQNLIQLGMQLLINEEITEEARAAVYDNNLYLSNKIEGLLKKKKKKKKKG
jgi:hypothetical protein